MIVILILTITVNDVFVAAVAVSQTDQEARVIEGGQASSGTQSTDGSGPISPALTVVSVLLAGLLACSGALDTDNCGNLFMTWPVRYFNTTVDSPSTHE